MGVWRRKTEAAKERSNCSLQKHSSITPEWIWVIQASSKEKMRQVKSIPICTQCFSLSTKVKRDTKCWHWVTVKERNNFTETMYQRSSIKLCQAPEWRQNCYPMFPVERAASCLHHDPDSSRTPQKNKRILQWIRNAWSSLYPLKCPSITGCILLMVFVQTLLLPISSLLSTEFLKLFFTASCLGWLVQMVSWDKVIHQKLKA